MPRPPQRNPNRPPGQFERQFKTQADYDAYWDSTPYPGSIGSAHSVSGDVDAESRADQVRRIAEEVSGKSFPRPVKRVGF